MFQIQNNSKTAVASQKENRILHGLGVGPGFRNRTLAVKSRKNTQKSVFFVKKYRLTKMIHFFIFLLALFDPKMLPTPPNYDQLCSDHSSRLYLKE